MEIKGDIKLERNSLHLVEGYFALGLSPNAISLKQMKVTIRHANQNIN